MYSVHYTVYNVHCTLYTVVYTEHIYVYSVQCTMYKQVREVSLLIMFVISLVNNFTTITPATYL